MKNLIKSLTKIPLTPKTYKELPEVAGVYMFFKDSTPIYIGKAINLKRRVSSYFDLDLAPKTEKMIQTSNFLSYIKVDSELESLLLEAKLIRQYIPHYNVLAKDDKHPLYIAITRDEYPRIISVRKLMANDKKLIASFGPFPSSRNVHSVLRWLRRIFPYSDHKLGKRACIYSHIGLCNPCPNSIQMLNNKLQMTNEKKEYLKNIRNIKSILEGSIFKVKNELEKEMEIDSKKQDFEMAAAIRNQIQTIEYITKPQIPTDFFIQNPNLIDETREKESKELQGILKSHFTNLKFVHRIECFDIAHLAGTNPTASMVTFVNGEAEKTLYRHFKIKVAKGGDDPNSMREVAQRRKKYLVGWGRPDLIIVDGGKTQVSSFVESFAGEKIPIIGLAKRLETFVIPRFKDTSLTFAEVRVPTGPILNLVQRIRNEAHRFARRYHHHLISREYKNAGNN
ncbi:MAG TPA: GIY-YIG nuclease family protein [Patescibacteria group bacterium]|nr:GIY-YIG nuclease family protein [Patescibacteria group bacterium]